MSSLAYDQNKNEIPQASPRSGSGEQLDDIRPIPRVTIQAFCETEAVSQTLESMARDRRTAKAHVKVHMGGISAAADFYTNAPTPNLIIVESGKSGSGLIDELSAAKIRDLMTYMGFVPAGAENVAEAESSAAAIR